MNDLFDKYNFRVVWSEEDQAYIGLIEEFPSLSWISQSQEEAIVGISRVVEKVLVDMQQEDERLPLGDKLP